MKKKTTIVVAGIGPGITVSALQQLKDVEVITVEQAEEREMPIGTSFQHRVEDIITAKIMDTEAKLPFKPPLNRKERRKQERSRK